MKSSRQEKILELISTYEISTQEELTLRLNELGYKTTQATVSRDIKALNLRKVPGSKGQRYSPADMSGGEDKYLRIFADSLTGMDQAANLAVIRTFSGMAMAAAAALDELHLEEIVGSIAGDDTIMCACRSEADAAALIARIRQLMKKMK
ncbi:MAG: arginine repressor [Parasporobacterium sp.]|nr:arginine repressor [Parasporobacterium sp.]